MRLKMRLILLGIAYITGASTATAEKVRFSVVGDNSADIAAYEKLKPEAWTALQTVQTTVARGNLIAQRYRMDGLTPEVPEHSRQVASLAREVEAKFGNTGTGPFSHCASVGAAAENMWLAQVEKARSGSSLFLDENRKRYLESLSACRNDIANPPSPTISVVGSGEPGKPPARGCLSVITTDKSGDTTESWTCPKSSEKLLFGRR